MKSNRLRWDRFGAFGLILLVSLLWSPFLLLVGAQEPGSGLESVLKTLQQAEPPKHSDIKSVLKTLQQTAPPKQINRNRFFWKKLWLDLPPDTVLVTRQGEPLVYVDEFNQRATTTRGEDLFQARYNALLKIIDTKLVAVLAKEEGFMNDPLVIKTVAKADGQVKVAQLGGVNEISDAEAQRYYDRHIEEFRVPDRGTRVLFVVKAERQETLDILERIKKGKPFEKFSFSSKPIPGSWLPVAAQDEIFHLKPNQMTDLIETPIGFYVVKLVERNAFDHFKLSIIVKKNIEQCQQVLKRIKAGEKFEAFIAEKEHQSIALGDLPKEVIRVVPDMEFDEVSQPITTPLGVFLVKLQERWSEAEIIAANLIRVNSKIEGEEILSKIKKGSDLGQLEERLIAGKDLPDDLRVVAKKLKEAEYSAPVKALLGYYLVKLQQRDRQLYKPFETVKEDVKRMIKAGDVSEKAALKYYNSYLSYYRKSAPEYILDIILAENRNKGEKILAELKKATETKEKNILFVKYQKGLGGVSAEFLPAACQNIAQELKPSRISPVIATPLGNFILRQNKKVDPAYLPFEDVKHEIKSVLVEQAEQRNGNEANIYVTGAKEEALAQVYYKARVRYNTEAVSNEEAEVWWQDNKVNYSRAFGILESQVDKVLLADTNSAMLNKKLGLLSDRYNAMIENLSVENNVVIYENLLN